MKILHLSDLHFGKRLNNFSLLEDQYHVNRQIFKLAKDTHIEAVIIAGDVFDRQIPSAGAVQLFDDFLNFWAELNLPVFIISGNHDSAERLSFGAHIFSQNNIYISPVYNGQIEPISLNDAYGKINFYLLPFIKPATVRPFFPDEKINSYTEAVQTVLNNLPLNKDERNILIAHQFVTGAVLSDSEEIVVGGLDNVDAHVFDAFDYVALGHIHTPQTILRDSIRYCGTLLKYSFSEANQQKCATVIDIKAKGQMDITAYPVKPLHDMRKIKGTYAELTDRQNYIGTDTDDYILATLTDEEDVPDAIGRLRSIYPNIMQLDYDNIRTRTRNNIETVDINTAKAPLELFGEFYKLQNNQPLNETQSQIMQDLIAAIWEGK
ncbi:exonuclease SbcCD subunit D [Megamonas hypermegale]|uniref:Nuclease SbcCD subunit D n=1 Tax=Megamonas hypermegale TaxID=158847 RepID=A0A921HN49_9FIRM|nr:exonuclease SbcCD subunit D [Megamonas hypermegale]MDM8142454.1 exonuclease SbcCD subunit D [Megamonas hypermegale]HJF84692.1 exonuclease SbcCD subunit D [Megamonas hypermegale]